MKSCPRFAKSRRWPRQNWDWQGCETAGAFQDEDRQTGASHQSLFANPLRRFGLSFDLSAIVRRSRLAAMEPTVTVACVWHAPGASCHISSPVDRAPLPQLPPLLLAAASPDKWQPSQAFCFAIRVFPRRDDAALSLQIWNTSPTFSALPTPLPGTLTPGVGILVFSFPTWITFPIPKCSRSFPIVALECLCWSSRARLQLKLVSSRK